MLDALLWQPQTTPQQWCEAMPCVEIFSTGIVLDQPLSTFLVYFLGGVWFWAAWRFRTSKDDQRSRQWWSISLVLGGIGAVVAGTSYQAFGYEIKCSGREFCSWTSWWEIAYMVIQVACYNAMALAVAFSCTSGRWHRLFIGYALLNSLVHFSVIVIGVITVNRLMLSFEMAQYFITPTLIIFIVLNTARYLKLRQPMDLALLISWLLLIATSVAYSIYMSAGYTQQLWEQGIWFSENDVLHVGVMVWLVYLGLGLSGKIYDEQRLLIQKTTGTAD